MKMPNQEGLNVVPFIDIMLVLLAIVLCISTFITKGEIQINLPDASKNEVKDDNKQKLEITIDKDNSIFIDGENSSIDSLESRVGDLERDVKIELRSDESSHFKTFVSVIDILKKHNHENFTILTKTSK